MPIVLSSLRVTGNGNVGTLNVVTTADVGTNICVNGATDMVGAVTAQSTTAITGVLTAMDNLCVTGTSDLTGAVTAQNNMCVVKTSALSNTVTIDDAKTLTLTNITEGDTDLGGAGGIIETGDDFLLTPDTSLQIGFGTSTMDFVRISGIQFFSTIKGSSSALFNFLDKSDLAFAIEFGSNPSPISLSTTPANVLLFDFESSPFVENALVIIYANTDEEWPGIGDHPFYRGEYLLAADTPGFTIISEATTFVTAGAPADTVSASFVFTAGPPTTVQIRLATSAGMFDATITYEIRARAVDSGIVSIS